MPDLRVEIDGDTWAVGFDGWGAPLRVATPPGELSPWTLRHHLDALRTCTDAGGGLDAGALAARVLAACWTGAPDGRLAALALWWAGGETPPVTGATAQIDATRVTLHPWSWAERASALHAAGALDDPPRLDLPIYLQAQARATVRAVAPPTAIEDLPAGPLLAAVLATNTPARPAWLHPAMADRTLQICRALGWPPSKVWESPAAEIDLALDLLEATQPPPAPPVQGLAAHPDAVVFRFED